jgi:GT2 family glycosyltransferase
MTQHRDSQVNGSRSSLVVSVVIVSWNARQYLVQCLESLSRETWRGRMEITVVDNASSDGSAEAVASKFPHVRLIRNSTNLGFAAANNLGLAASTGQYVCLINSDVKVLPDCINHLVDYCEAHPGVGLVGPLVLGGDGKLQRSCRGFPTLGNMFWRALGFDNLFPNCKSFGGYLLRHWPQDSVAPVDILTGCFWLLRRQALSEVGLLDETFFMYGEDMDWCKRFWAEGWEIVFVPSAEAIHYGGASSANAPVRFYIELHRANLQYWQKHHPRPEVLCYFLLTCIYLLLRATAHWLALPFGSVAREERWHKVKRSLLTLRWMFSSGIKQAWQRPAPGIHVTTLPKASPKASETVVVSFHGRIPTQGAEGIRRPPAACS